MLLICIFCCGCENLATAKVDDNFNKNKIRAFLAAKLAQTVMVDTVTPEDDENAELCDGSGWITHGDGHKTACPGCNSCKPSAVMGSEHTLYVYHFGAEWCVPCKRMKTETWENEDLKQYMKDNRIQLFILDRDNPEHNSMFSYYNITSYPTVVFVKPDDLNKTLKKILGFAGPGTIKQLIEDVNEQ